MKIEPLSLMHQALLAPKWGALALPLSEYSFASRYLFRRGHDLHVVWIGERVWLKGKMRDGTPYLMPTEDMREIPEAELCETVKGVDCFYPIPEEWIPSFQRFQIHFDRDDSDYLYTREQIADYPGRHLSAKRNLVKQFQAAYTAEIVEYQPRLAEDALSILHAWQGRFDGKESDFLPCQDGIRLFLELGLSGYLVYIEGNPAALILGESFGFCFVVHFAKALTEYKGIYPYLFQELARRLPVETIRWLNWEQDLGQEGLRQSKLSYQPHQLASKYRLSIYTAATQKV
ncbi:MAG: DUF2156 domain-containing protein [Chlamydiales bacterium]